VRGSYLETTKEVGYHKEVRLYSAIFFLFMCVFAVISISMWRCPKSQWAVKIYTIICLFWALVFIAIAILAPSYVSQAVTMVDDQCANKTEPVWIIDGVYLTAN
jgi:magnesium-transporting ATPase (P-type)